MIKTIHVAKGRYVVVLTSSDYGILKVIADEEKEDKEEIINRALAHGLAFMYKKGLVDK